MAPSRGDVPGEKPLIRVGFAGEDRVGEPMGPKSTDGFEPWRPENRTGCVGLAIG